MMTCLLPQTYLLHIVNKYIITDNAVAIDTQSPLCQILTRPTNRGESYGPCARSPSVVRPPAR